MPVKSYLVHAAPQQATRLAVRLAQLPGCTAVAAENRDALVLVTDTTSEDADRALRQEVEALDGLISLTLVSAFAADDDLISLSPGGQRP